MPVNIPSIQDGTYYTDEDMEAAINITVGATMIANRYIEMGNWTYATHFDHSDVEILINCGAEDSDDLMAALRREFSSLDNELYLETEDDENVVITLTHRFKEA
jgi:hypothetical protein